MDWLTSRPGVVVAAVVVSLLLLGYILYNDTSAIAPAGTASNTGQYAEVIATYFTPLTPLALAGETIQVSLADSVEMRTKGLSDTPVLPPGMGKLFIFDELDEWGFWMKDMQYPLDIIWLDQTRRIVHIEADVAPETYPETFRPATAAQYVLEVNAGASAQYGWAVGDQAAW